MRWVAGLLLICAAVLKAVEILNEPTAVVAHPLGRWFLPAQIGIELGLGLLVLSGFYWTRLRWLTVFLFTAFAGYSFHVAMTGALSCGCFGPLHIHPWWTFVLDVVVVLGLLISAMRRDEASNVITLPVEACLVGPLAARRTVLAALMGACVVVAAVFVRYVDRQTAAAEGISAIAGDLVILEPEKWVGQKLPVAGFVDIDLSQGKWIVLFHRHDCPACHEAVSKFDERATDEQVALIEVPPYGDSEPRQSRCRVGRLKDDREWFVQTPLEIQLSDGVVAAAIAHGH